MKRLYTVISLMTILSITALSACSLLGPPPPTAAPSQSDPATEAPSTDLVVDKPNETPTSLVEVPIDLAGPPMEVGSFYTYVDGSILAAVPGGSFLMGYNNYFDTKEHEVTLSDYWIYTSEVTNQQYALCVNSGKCTPPDPKDNEAFDDYRLVSYPVTGVDYQQAVDYCTFVHGRLPTEAEWEKSARGEEDSLYPWGDKAPVCDLLNFNFCKGKAIDVKSYPDGVSYYGLFDMSGNVREWTADWYQQEYATDAASTNDPLGPVLGEKRSVRSSSYQDSADFAILPHRFSLRPENHLPDLGFRCVVDDPTYYAPFCEGTLLYGADINGNPTDDALPVPNNCNQSTISGTTDCKKTTDTFITPNVAPGASLDPIPASCVGGPPTWQCSGSGTVSISPQTCNYPAPPNGGTCSPGYVEKSDPNDPNKKICIGQGPGENCPEGFGLDPLLNCCSATNPGPNQFGLCGPGFYKQGNACIPSANNPPPLVTVSYNFSPVPLCPNTTSGCDPEKDPTCQQQPSTCTPFVCRIGKFDPVTCSCQ